MAAAFVLLNVKPGKDEEVLVSLRKIEGVKEAHRVYGVYDIIAKFEAESAEGLRSLLEGKVRRLDDVRSTITMIIP